MAQGTRSTEIEFGELANSEKFTAAIRKLNATLDGTKAQLEALAKCDIETFSIKDQVMLDLYLTYSVNSLYWMFLRTKGINSATHPIKSEINRVREGVARANKIYNRKRPATQLDKEAAKRFIRSGLWKPGEKPVGGVVKKFHSTSVEVKASSSVSKDNENVAEDKQLNPPNGDINHVVKKCDPKSFGNVKASSSKVNEKGGETKQIKASDGNTEGFVNKFNPKCVEDEKDTLSCSKGNKNVGDIKQFTSTNKQPQGVLKKFDSMNIGAVKASSSFNNANKKGGQTLTSTNWKPDGSKKFDSTNTNIGAVNDSSFSQASKKGSGSKQCNGKIGKKAKHN